MWRESAELSLSAPDEPPAAGHSPWLHFCLPAAARGAQPLRPLPPLPPSRNPFLLASSFHACVGACVPPASPSPSRIQIRFFLLQNRQGKTRLSKWYVAIEEEEMRKIESEIHRIVTSRDSKYTNFVEVRRGAGVCVRVRACVFRGIQTQ